MELMSSGALPSPNNTPLMNDLNTNANIPNLNGNGGVSLGGIGAGGNDSIQQQQQRPSVAMYRDVNGSYHGLPTPGT